MVEKICIDKSKKPFFLRDDGEELVVSMSEGLCAITDIGAIIIRGLNAGESLKEIVDSINADYDVSYDELKTDIVSFISELQGMSIISDRVAQQYLDEMKEL